MMKLFWITGNCQVKNLVKEMKKDEQLADNCDNKSTLTAHLGAFILSNSRRNTKNFIREIDGFHNISLFY